MANKKPKRKKKLAGGVSPKKPDYIHKTKLTPPAELTPVEVPEKPEPDLKVSEKDKRAFEKRELLKNLRKIKWWINSEFSSNKWVIIVVTALALLIALIEIFL